MIVVLEVLLLGWLWLMWDQSRQSKVTASMASGVLTLLLLLLWFLLLSRIRRRWKLLGAAALLATGLFLAMRYEIRGVTGDLRPILSRRGDAAAVQSAIGRASDAAPVTASGLEFPQFLGPSRNGKISGIELARDWKARPPREVWRRPVGEGWASFAVWGDVAVTQEQHGDEERVVAYDLSTGEARWSHTDRARFATTIGGVGPRATPAIDGTTVYTMGATGVLNALELASGRPLWSRDLVAEYKVGLPEWGKSGSPLLVDDLVVVTAGSPGSAVMAFRRDSGAEVWSAGSDGSSYSSPLVATLAGVRQIVVFNQGSVVGHDPLDGTVLWQYPWPSEFPNVAQPLPLGDDRLLVSSGYGIGAKMLEIVERADGGLIASLVWETPRLKAKFAHYVEYQGSVYGLDDGILVCLDPETGERRWKRGRYGHGQFLLVGDLMLLQAENGDVVLIEPDPEELRELARFTAFDRKTWNIPTLAGRYLLLRNDREAALYELPLVSG